jgi:hypothetical protein
MNIQSEIEFFSDLGLLDKARFITRLIFEIAEEAKVGNGDGNDAVRYSCWAKICSARRMMW